LKDKIKNYKNFDKRTKKKSKIERPNKKILYTQIRIEEQNWKQIKLLKKKKLLKSKSKTKRMDYETPTKIRDIFSFFGGRREKWKKKRIISDKPIIFKWHGHP